MRPEDTLHPELPWLDPHFSKNRSEIPAEELERYAGQYVAWSWDGTCILAGASTEEELYRKLTDAGIDCQHVVTGHTDPPDLRLG